LFLLIIFIWCPTPYLYYRPNLRLIPPLRLEPEVLDFLATRAKERGTTVNQLVNQLLKKDMELIQAAAG